MADELTPQERAAVLAWHMVHGWAPDVEQAAKITQLRQPAAGLLLERVARFMAEYQAGEELPAESQERATAAVARLCWGWPVRAWVLRAEMGITRQAVYRMLWGVSRVAPVYCDGGVWLVCAGDGEREG